MDNLEIAKVENIPLHSFGGFVITFNFWAILLGLVNHCLNFGILTFFSIVTHIFAAIYFFAIIEKWPSRSLPFLSSLSVLSASLMNIFFKDSPFFFLLYASTLFLFLYSMPIEGKIKHFVISLARGFLISVAGIGLVFGLILCSIFAHNNTLFSTNIITKFLLPILVVYWVSGLNKKRKTKGNNNSFNDSSTSPPVSTEKLEALPIEITGKIEKVKFTTSDIQKKTGTIKVAYTGKKGGSHNISVHIGTPFFNTAMEAYKNNSCVKITVRRVRENEKTIVLCESLSIIE